MDTGRIYKITNTVTGRSYIGQTTMPLKRRWSRHISDARRYATSNEMYKDINDRGPEIFHIETLCENIPRTDLNKFETEHIDKHNTQAPYGYNIQRGGGNYVRSPSTRLKISETLKGRPQHPNSGMLGRAHSEDTKEKMSSSQIGRIFSDETKQRMCDAKIKALSSEQVNAIRDKFKSGQFQCELAKEYNVSKQTICNVVNYKKVYASIGN